MIRQSLGLWLPSGRKKVSDFGKNIRLSRIFKAPDRKSLVVAFDHGLVRGPIAGTIDPAGQFAKFVKAGADAIMMHFGMLRQAQVLLQYPAPSLILRLDWSSVWASLISKGKLHTELLGRPEQALRNGADAVITFLFVGTGDLEFEARQIGQNAEVARECERIGLPLMIETLARGDATSNRTSAEWIKLHTRMAAEIGADVVKTEYTGDVTSMREVVSICPIPILVLGGERQSDSVATQIISGIVDSGAAGVFFGRNVFQSDDVVDFLKHTRALLDQASDRRSHVFVHKGDNA
jgi:DhnA family fructose-bisphosphate aldolase class Ia